MKDVTINGHAVVLFDEDFPAARFHGAFVALSDYQKTGDFAHDIGPYCPFVESWDFQGDPLDILAWGKLDWIKDLSPLVGEIGIIFEEMFAAIDSDLDEGAEKNSG